MRATDLRLNRSSSTRTVAVAVSIGLVWSAVGLSGCGSSPETGSEIEGRAPSESALQFQEKKVSELRKTHGSDSPETLKALARLIRLRTAAGDIESGAELFDELISLDLRTSPILAYATPPVELTRHLGGLGELTAAKRQLEASMGTGKGLFGSKEGFAGEAQLALNRLRDGFVDEAQLALNRPRDGFVGEAQLALNRLRVAFGDISDEELSSLDLAPDSSATAGPRIRFSDRPVIGKRDWSFMPQGDFWSAGMGGHEHFDNILDISPTSGLETAERLRSTSNSGELSLVTRIRRHGRLVAQPNNFGGANWQPADTAPTDSIQVPFSPSGAPPERNATLLDLVVQIQALTRALDRIPSDDERFEAILEERGRLQRQRAQELNTSWNSGMQVYVPTTLRGLQQALDPETVVLYYMTTKDHTDLIVIPTVGLGSKHRIPLGIEDLEGEIASFLDDRNLRHPRGVAAVTDSGPGGEADVSRRLYDALLAPADQQVREAARLLIIPDGPLHKLPFSALALPTGRYLAQTKPLALAPSAAAFVALAARRPRVEEGGGRTIETSGSLLAFGDPAYGASGDAEATRTLPYAVRSATERGFSGGLPPLPGSGREARQIGELFESRGLEARVHLGAAATEKAAKEQIETATFVHFAVHGFVDGEQPEHSFLALALPATLAEGEENGIVEGWEIVDELQTTAELVTLSACETSLGRERSGEGPSSLSRAFLAAGARSVLSALWKVDDAATSELMVRFYRNLTAGTSKAEALRLAQVELIESPDLGYQAPVFWAGFQLTGDWK